MQNIELLIVDIAKRIESGSCGGKAAIEAFTELRWITIQSTPRHYPF